MSGWILGFLNLCHQHTQPKFPYPTKSVNLSGRLPSVPPRELTWKDVTYWAEKTAMLVLVKLNIFPHQQPPTISINESPLSLPACVSALFCRSECKHQFFPLTYHRKWNVRRRERRKIIMGIRREKRWRECTLDMPGHDTYTHTVYTHTTGEVYFPIAPS